jgi:meso-butanediol dehydrogenase / (S,S)-butanediol dehydrogenase / diacetyl reductase
MQRFGGRFEGKVALVTAAAQGIGRAVAERIASEGGRVAVTDLRADAAQRVADELTKAGHEAIGLACDVTSRDAVTAAVASTVERFGRLDVLVNNAGGCIVNSAYTDVTDDEWHSQLDLTLIGANRCIQAALPHLLESHGNVVTIGSVNGLVAFGNIEYSTAKAGLRSLTQNLACEYGSQGVRFNLVAPGTIRTPNWDDQPGRLERLAGMYPLGRVGEPEDIAAAVAFLGSDDAAWITGITLPVEGGVLTGPATGWMGPQND